MQRIYSCNGSSNRGTLDVHVALQRRKLQSVSSPRNLPQRLFSVHFPVTAAVEANMPCYAPADITQSERESTEQRAVVY